METAAEIKSEIPFWKHLDQGWQPVFGNIQQLGFSIEWHEFSLESDLEWSGSFHPDCFEICLNLEGSGTIECAKNRVVVAPSTSCLYHQGLVPLNGRRNRGESHKFLTLELSMDFIRSQLPIRSGNLHPVVQTVLRASTSKSVVGDPLRLSTAQRDLINLLRNPPVLVAAQTIWYRAKVLELLADLFFQAPTEELFCTRQKRVAADRVEQVTQILREQLVEPPGLEAIAQRVGCSPYYLSRTFSAEMGMTIPQYLRSLRIEKAAELLRSGKYNVTEAAMEVGYNSMSHFSQAFCRTMGVCPVMYPDAKPKSSK